MDIPYRIPGDVVSGSVAFASPTLLPDSNSLLSDSDIFATSARGSFGVDPGPAPLVSLSVSSIGDWLYGVRKRLVLSRSLMSSHFAMTTSHGSK